VLGFTAKVKVRCRQRAPLAAELHVTRDLHRQSRSQVSLLTFTGVSTPASRSTNASTSAFVPSPEKAGRISHAVFRYAKSEREPAAFKACEKLPAGTS
jgi:hypothetical protein